MSYLWLVQWYRDPMRSSCIPHCAAGLAKMRRTAVRGKRSITMSASKILNQSTPLLQASRQGTQTQTSLSSFLHRPSLRSQTARGGDDPKDGQVRTSVELVWTTRIVSVSPWWWSADHQARLPFRMWSRGSFIENNPYWLATSALTAIEDWAKHEQDLVD